MTLVSVLLIASSIALPIFIQTVIHYRWEVMAVKEARESFNVLLEKFDKRYKLNIYLPGLFFAKRFLTA